MKKFPQLTKALKNFAAICGIATCFLASSIDGYGQTPGTAIIDLDANDIATIVRNDGQLFWDGRRSRYTVPRGGIRYSWIVPICRLSQV